VTLRYGFVKGKLVSDPRLTSAPHKDEIQYHLHFGMTIDVVPWDAGLNGNRWDFAINVGTTDADDLLQFKLVYDFRHSLIETLRDAPDNSVQELTGTNQLPALDFLRTDLLDNTGRWRDSDSMDGTDEVEPIASLKRLLLRARQNNWNVYVFGRFYKDRPHNGSHSHNHSGPPSLGIHDAHLNQGSVESFIHRPGNDGNDHNDVWQDGAVIVDVGQPQWAAYFGAFHKQFVPTDDLGNPAPGAKPI
jgi:uncharacterized protein YukJ